MIKSLVLHTQPTFHMNHYDRSQKFKFKYDLNSLSCSLSLSPSVCVCHIHCVQRQIQSNQFKNVCSETAEMVFFLSCLLIKIYQISVLSDVKIQLNCLPFMVDLFMYEKVQRNSKHSNTCTSNALRIFFIGSNSTCA